MDKKYFGLILAGGQGTRFWPWSTEDYPKQFLDIIGDEPLITQTYNRLKMFIPAENIYIVAELRYLGHIVDAIPGFSQRNFITEPMARNTAPSMILANIYLSRINPEANVIVVPADHYIPDTEEFAAQMRNALDFADNKCIVTCGIKPNMPHTGYGYIQFNESKPSMSGKMEYFDLIEFKEKPKLEVAEKYLREGNYYWNSGMFVYKLSHFKEFLGEYDPEYFIQYNELVKVFHSKLAFYELFSTMRKDSIDYALLEKMTEVKMFKSEFTWNDLGAWSTVYELNPKEAHDNVSRGLNNVFIDSFDSMIFSTQDKPIALIGLKNVAVIDTPNGVLVANMDQLQRVKEALNALKARNPQPEDE